MELRTDVALIAGLMGDPARAAILAALVEGRALPAGELAFVANIAPQTASFHLHKLMDVSLITLEKQGKHSYYRLANERVAATLESIAALAPTQDGSRRPRTRRESERIKELRFARSCYKHLAGMLAVNLNQALLDRAFLVANSQTTYCLTDSGQEWFRQLGANLPKSRPQQNISSRACIDWTERRRHVGGVLGSVLFSRLTELGWIVKDRHSRAVRVTHAGARALERQLGIQGTLETVVTPTLKKAW